MTAGGDLRPRIEAAPVITETLQSLLRLARWAPRLAWPAFAVALVVALLDSYVIPYRWAGSVLYVVVLPFDIMLAVAWHRLILLGSGTVDTPPVRWRRRHLHYLVFAVIFIAVLGALVVLFVLAMGAMPLPMLALLLATGAGIWLIVTVLTPLALQLPAKATETELPADVWQGWTANFGNAALVWLVFLAIAYGLGITAQAFYEPAGAPLGLELASIALSLVLDYVLLLMNVTVITVMYRHLANLDAPADAQA